MNSLEPSKDPNYLSETIVALDFNRALLPPHRHLFEATNRNNEINLFDFDRLERQFQTVCSFGILCLRSVGSIKAIVISISAV